MVPVLTICGVAAVLTGQIRAAGDSDRAGPWVLIGMLAGVGLYLATRAFMVVAGRWQRLAEGTAALYANEDAVRPGRAFVLAALISSPAEELLWRGVVLAVLTDALTGWDATWGPSIGGALAWFAYIAANAAGGSLPILLGAVVSGGMWTALGAFSSGVAAPIACHVVWTALMILVPPRPASR
jgi:membrane protease YdiL (CAAX protease family)